MTYLPEESKVVYGPKDGKDEEVFDASEWVIGDGEGACRGVNSDPKLKHSSTKMIFPKELRVQRTGAEAKERRAEDLEKAEREARKKERRGN